MDFILFLDRLCVSILAYHNVIQEAKKLPIQLVISRQCPTIIVWGQFTKLTIEGYYELM